MSIDELIARMTALLEQLQAAGDGRAAFHATYLRTTQAVADSLRAGMFSDRDWVERWDVAFADLYLDALEAANRGQPVAKPWAVAFTAAAERRDLPALRHVLLGMNAHINYDLPQALLAVITDSEFDDAGVRARREADHRRIDDVLARRTRAEDDALQRLQPARAWRDRVMQPLNRGGTRRFLRESRAKVWANALLLSQARRQGAHAYAQRLAELEQLSAARVADLVRPGPVIMRLALGGFGVSLSPRPGPARSPGPLRSFNPLEVGRLECGVWAAYYRGQRLRFLVLCVRMVRGAFGMSWPRTCYGAWLVLRANRLWAPVPDNDPGGARKNMRRFYTLLRAAHGEPADPAQAARLEVDWWAIHRARQRGNPDGGPEPLVAALARLYSAVFNVAETDALPAAQHRADAMDLSDRWVADGCKLGSPLLAAERAALIRSYAALLAAVHR